MACTPLDHSDYARSTNHWNALEKVRDLKGCEACGLPTFDTWWRAINWDFKESWYWKSIYEQAEGLAFFYKFEGDRWSPQTIFPNDEDRDVVLQLRPRGPKLWLGKTLVDEIRQYRYRHRLRKPKKHHYGWRQGFIDAAIQTMHEEVNDSCIDNTRFAAVNNRKDMRRYWRQAERGCCGRHDEQISVFGRKFMIGCNYGH